MVQTKVPSKHSPQNRGADLKKKMKKSRPIKRAELESVRSTSLKKEVPNPEKPPPPPDDPTSPQKQFHIKAHEASPNYMKSTSSFEARRTSSGKTQLSSSKLVRSLTKTPSFKPARSYSVKKCSPVALCENLNNVQRATCSSTLKNSKFPSYLGLSPGASESEGSSAIKVCPYTYCSLNAHHHRAPLPPLKCFLTARRRMLKTQKSIKLKAETQGVGLDRLERNSQEQDNQVDFFIEIYAREAAIGGSKANGDEQGENKFVADDSVVGFEKDFETSDMEWDDGDSDVSSSTQPIFQIGHIVNINFDVGGPEETFEEGGNGGYDFEGPFQNSASLEHMENKEDSSKVLEEENLCPRMDDRTDSGGNVKGGAWIDGQENESLQDNDSVWDQECSSPHNFSISDHDEDNQSDVNGEEIVDSGRGQSTKQEMKTEQQLGEEKVEATSRNMESKQDIVGLTEKECHKAQTYRISDSTNSEDQTNLALDKVIMAANSNENANETEAEESPISDTEENFSPAAAEFAAREQAKPALFRRRSYPIEESPKYHNNLRIVRGKRPLEELGEITRKFNPREPNYLPVEPDPEAERVDLRHQMMEERRNAEEWMIDHALQKAVTNLATARKKKVALLVEAFEKVIPTPKHEEPLQRRASTGFVHPRTIQACI